jgi:Holliday junction resolvase RusA-like endonuclease
MIIKLDKIVLHSQSTRYSAKGGFLKKYTTKEYKDFKNDVRNKIKEQFKEHIFEEAIHVDMFIYYPLNKSWSDKKKREMVGQPKTTIPDKDNVEKSINDAMCDIVFVDDKYITSSSVKKRWGSLDQEQIEIHINVREDYNEM